MKVSDIMHTDVDYVTPGTSVLDAVKLIFKHKHSGLPVVIGKRGKLIGFITDQDILSQCFPSMKEYMEDVVHARNFDAMEEKVKEIMKLKVKDVMNRNVMYVEKNTPLLNAESMMKVKDIARLPVVDEKGRLIGILTKREIFRALVGKHI